MDTVRIQYGAKVWTRPPLAFYQTSAVFTEKRYSFVEATTKGGKTAVCLIWLLEQALQGQRNWNYWWIAPVYDQAKIAFNRMKHGLKGHLFKANKSDLTITLIGGQVIRFKSGNKPDNLYGEDVYAAVIDEASRIAEESWVAVRSTLTATRGPIRVIGNVKGRKNWAFKLARIAERGVDPDMHYARITALDAIAAGVIEQSEVDDARKILSEDVFKELYMAEPGEADGRVFSSFDFAQNCDEDIGDPGADLSGPLLIGMDFNVNPMTACMGHRKGDNLNIWKEFYLKNSNTEKMCKAIRAFIGDTRQAIVYPDATGSKRGTNVRVGDTDHSIIREFGFEVIAPPANPPVIDRINSTNAMLCTSSGLRRTKINPTNCPHLVETLDGLIWDEKGGIDKKMGLDHMGDGFGYLIHSEFPMIDHSPEQGRLYG